MVADWSTVTEFEKQIAKFFGAPFAVAVDSCTHGIELCLRYTDARSMTCPNRTYLSVPMLAKKLNITLHWMNWNWRDHYMITPKILDAAVLWRPNSYISNMFMCVSFQYQKHLSLSRGGVILCDNKDDAIALKKMSYDGRIPCIPWRDQNISSYGFHYYMTPEIAALGLLKLSAAIATPPRQWKVEDWPNLLEMDVFKR